MDELWRLLASPVPTYTMFGSDGAMRDGADGFVRLVVELRLPVVAAVGGLPQAAGGEPDVDDHRILLGAGDIVDAAHHGGRSDGAELEAAQQRVGGSIGWWTLGRAAPTSLRPNQPRNAQAGGGDD